MLAVAPRQRPVDTSQNHQLGLNAFDGPCSCWFVKHVHASAVKAVAVTRGESRRIKRLFVRRPFSGLKLDGELTKGGRDCTKDDEPGTEGSGCRPAASGLESEEYRRDSHDAAERGIQPHGHIRHTILEVVFTNLLEVKVSIEPSEPPKQGNEHLGEWRMYVHEEFALDVLGCKAAKADSPVSSSVVDESIQQLTGLRQRRHLLADIF